MAGLGIVKLGCRSPQNKLSDRGINQSLSSQWENRRTSVFLKIPRMRPECHTRQEGKGVSRKGRMGVPRVGGWVGVFLKIGRCKFADEHFFPTEDKRRCCQLKLC